MKKIIFTLTISILLCFFSSCTVVKENIYYDEDKWAYLGVGENKNADLFFICPTVFKGSLDKTNMEFDNNEANQKFVGAINMELGIYDNDCRIFAPYYRQASLYAYSQGGEILDNSIDKAYEDVSKAFLYYMKNLNNGKPVVLAGFSQGAELCIRLMKDYFENPEYKKLLVATYAVGWSLTEDDIENYPHLLPAQGETDTGVIISFNSEAEHITESMIIPQNTKTYSINPLNWKTNSTPANKSQNLGACFTNYSGKVEKEIPQLCGAYIDEIRGALKVTDITEEEYPPVLPIFESGIYHLYDYQFFYRNLQENVTNRIQAYLQ